MPAVPGNSSIDRLLLEELAVVEAQGGQLAPPGAAGVQAGHAVLEPESQSRPVSEDDNFPPAAALRHVEPSPAAVGRLLRQTAERGAHTAVRPQGAEPCEAGEGDPGAIAEVTVLEGLVPALVGPAADAGEQAGRAAVAQRSLSLPRQL